MEQPALIVDIARDHAGLSEQHVFARSPVHIGRGSDNELPIDHVFVSHCHGVLHFDARVIEFVDLGSTNGSYLDGARVQSHQRIAVHAGGALSLGPVRLRVALDATPPKSRRTLAEQLSGPAPHDACDGHGEQLAAVLAQLAESFLALSRTQRQWREDMGLAARAPRGLHACPDALALVGYLLAPEQAAERLTELGLACDELVQSERALMQALGSGARALLDELSPQALAPSGLSGLVDSLARVFGHDPRWRAFERQHAALSMDGARGARALLSRHAQRAHRAAREEALR